MTYFKYVERNAEDQINWAEVGKNMSDMLRDEAAAREQKKAALEQDSREYGEILSNNPTGNYDASNTFSSTYANSQQEYRLLQDRLFKSGQLSLRDYTRNRQNGKDGTEIVYSLAREYEKEFNDKMKRYADKVSSYQEVYKMEQAEGLANLREVEAYINPTNGVVSLGKKVQVTKNVNGKNVTTTTLSKDPNDVVTAMSLRDRIRQKIDRMQVDEFAAGAADQLGSVETAVMRYAKEGSLNTILTKIDAKEGNYGVEGDTFAATYLDWESDQIDAGMENPNDAASILVDRALKAPNGKQYTFTSEPDAKKRESNEIYLDPTKGPTADGVPVLSDDQDKAARDILKTAIRAQIDDKVQTKSAGATQYKPASSVASGKSEDNQVSIVNNFAKLYYGTKEEKEDAADSIRAYNPNVESVSLSEDGESVVITFTDASGLPPETLSFGDDQKSFVESGMNFVLSGDDKIGDINEVIKRGGIDLSKPKLSGADYMFTSMGDVTTTLPFEEAFTQREGSKLDVTKISDLADTAITRDEEDEAVDIMNQMVKSVPNTEDVKVTQFGIGRGINVEIDGKTYAIDLKQPTKVPEQFELIKKALVEFSLQNNILMDEDAKKQYVKDYGQVRKNKPAGTAPKGGGAGSAPRKKKP